MPGQETGQGAAARLAYLLADCGIGDTYISPPPRGGSLTGVSKERVLDLLAELGPGPVDEARLVFGNACFAVGRYAEAAEAFRALVDRSPGNPVFNFNLGLCRIRLREPEEALLCFDRALNAVEYGDPARAQIHYQRGNALDDLEKGEQAVAEYSAAIELDPGYLRAHYNRGIVLGKLGRHSEAVEQFDLVVELRPDLSNAFLNRGASLDEMAEHEAAVNDYTEAILLDPDNVNAWFNRARTRYYLGQVEDAADDYSHVIALRPDDAEAWNNRGLAYDAMGDYQRALRDYNEATAIRPDFVEVYSNRGAALEALGDDEGAMREYAAAMDARNGFAVAYFNAARLCAKLGRLDESLEYLGRAESLEPGWRAEAERDEHLGWLLNLDGLRRKRETRG